MNKCRFCGKLQETALSNGYCVSCYQYFVLHNFTTWYPSQYGELASVQDEYSNQYKQIICHECGKAFTKLQQHIWYQHHMTKHQYCDKWGLDHKVRMTSDSYNKKMSDYAYKYKMDEQVVRIGKATRFKKGHDNKYKRSYQTRLRLEKNFKKDK